MKRNPPEKPGCQPGQADELNPGAYTGVYGGVAYSGDLQRLAATLQSGSWRGRCRITPTLLVCTE